MLGEKIRQLRMNQGLTQKDLAEKLFVTAQAVSRWEKNEVEPSVDTLVELSKIFKVSVSEIIGEKVNEPAPQKNEEPEKEVDYQQPKQMLALCEQCNEPIYDGKDIVRVPFGRGNTQILCSKCHKKNEEVKRQTAIDYGVGQRKKSFVWAPIISVILLIILLSVGISNKLGAPFIIGSIAVSIASFTFVSCLFLKNNFIMEMVLTIASWGFVKFPGLIFSLDLDGIIWLITVKLAFWIIGFIIGAVFLFGGVALGLVLSVIVYPFALQKNFESPELTEL